MCFTPCWTDVLHTVLDEQLYSKVVHVCFATRPSKHTWRSGWGLLNHRRTGSARFRSVQSANALWLAGLSETL